MAQIRKNPIPEHQQEVLTAIGNRIRELRRETGLNLEMFCIENKLPRISYSNLEAGRNFQMTTLLTIIAKHPKIKSLADFFKDI